MGEAKQCPRLGQRRCKACGKWIEQDEDRYECARCGLNPLCVEPCGLYHARHGATVVETEASTHKCMTGDSPPDHAVKVSEKGYARHRLEWSE